MGALRLTRRADGRLAGCGRCGPSATELVNKTEEKSGVRAYRDILSAASYRLVSPHTGGWSMISGKRLAAGLSAAATIAATLAFSRGEPAMRFGAPSFKSLGQMAFGPNNVLFIGDND